MHGEQEEEAQPARRARQEARHVRTVWAAVGVGSAGAAEGGGDPRPSGKQQVGWHEDEAEPHLVGVRVRDRDGVRVRGKVVGRGKVRARASLPLTLTLTLASATQPSSASR